MNVQVFRRGDAIGHQRRLMLRPNADHVRCYAARHMHIHQHAGCRFEIDAANADDPQRAIIRTADAMLDQEADAVEVHTAGE